MRDDAQPGVLDVYYPLDVPDLYARFAELDRHATFDTAAVPPVDETAILQFIESWGLPWHEDWRGNPDPGRLPSVAEIKREARTLHVGIALCAEWPKLPSEVEQVFPDASLDPLSRGNPFVWLEERFRDYLSDVAEYPVLRLGNHARGLRRDYSFRSLLGPMWLQLAETLADGLIEAQCRFRNCRLIIPDPKPGQLYCNTNCKRNENQASYRESKKTRRN